jgi:hypothetical protein
MIAKSRISAENTAEGYAKIHQNAKIADGAFQWQYI